MQIEAGKDHVVAVLRQRAAEIVALGALQRDEIVAVMRRPETHFYLTIQGRVTPTENAMAARLSRTGLLSADCS